MYVFDRFSDENECLLLLFTFLPLYSLFLIFSHFFSFLLMFSHFFRCLFPSRFKSILLDLSSSFQTNRIDRLQIKTKPSSKSVSSHFIRQSLIFIAHSRVPHSITHFVVLFMFFTWNGNDKESTASYRYIKSIYATKAAALS